MRWGNRAQGCYTTHFALQNPAALLHWSACAPHSYAMCIQILRRKCAKSFSKTSCLQWGLRWLSGQLTRLLTLPGCLFSISCSCAVLAPSLTAPSCAGELLLVLYYVTHVYYICAILCKQILLLSLVNSRTCSPSANLSAVHLAFVLHVISFRSGHCTEVPMSLLVFTFASHYVAAAMVSTHGCHNKRSN